MRLYLDDDSSSVLLTRLLRLAEHANGDSCQDRIDAVSHRPPCVA